MELLNKLVKCIDDRLIYDGYSTIVHVNNKCSIQYSNRTNEKGFPYLIELSITGRKSILNGIKYRYQLTNLFKYKKQFDKFPITFTFEYELQN